MGTVWSAPKNGHILYRKVSAKITNPCSDKLTFPQYKNETKSMAEIDGCNR